MPDHKEEQNYELARRFYRSLLACEEISSDELIDHQRSVASTFLDHVDQNVPFYHGRLDAIRQKDGSFGFERWHEVPILTKQQFNANYDRILCSAIPKEHGRITYSQSSATTGVPVRVPKTQLTDLATGCAALRHAEAHNVDWSVDIAYIRALATQRLELDPPDPDSQRRGPPWFPAKGRGKRHWASIHLHPVHQLEWLTEREPVYLNTSPSNALRLARTVAESGIKPPRLVAIYSIGETVDDDIREQIREHLGCEIIDVLATSECGTIATQCRVSGGYHILSELAIVEVVDDDGKPCGYGEPGRVAVTPLFNLATPLIRYRLDDYVSLSPPCPCGRPSPLIGTIHGRRDSLFTFANGTFGQLNLSTSEMVRYMGSCRWQIAQTAEDMAEIRYMRVRQDDSINEKGAISYVRLQVGSGIRVTCREVAALGPSSSGKFMRVSNEIARKS